MNSRRVFGLLLVATLANWLSPLPAPGAKDAAKDEPAAGRAAAALYEGIRAETLENGLRVYLKPIPEAPTVTTMVAYKVGSSDEDLDNTGLSHYLEHLMFKGTDKIMPGDIDRLTLRNGGANNANTSEDMTVYHFDFAADRWEAALEVEADRMRNLRIDSKHEFEQEKGAVISELERDEDEPWDLEMKAILPLLFGKTTPYGHPVIGERVHVRGATAAIIKAHYDKWYHPNNAALIVCGGFDADKALVKIKEVFGPIPAGKLPERKAGGDARLERTERKEFESKFDVPRMLMGFRSIRSDHPDYHALEVVQNLLSSGKTSRLYKKFVEGEEVATSVSAGNNAGRYPGWFSIQLELIKGKDRDKNEKLVLKELQRLCDEPVSAVELNRVRQTILSGTVFARESVHDLADNIARGVTTNDLDFLKNYLPRIQAVTAEDVKRVAKKYLDPGKNFVVVWSVPPGAGGGADKAKEGDKPRRRRSAARFDAGGAGQFSLKDAQRVELPNGMVVLLFENHRLPLFVAKALVRHTAILEPEDKAGVAMLTGALLDEGTAKHSGPQIAETIENVGGTLSLEAGGGSVQVLASQRKLGLELLFECLSQPSFPKEAFQRERAQQLSRIDEAEQQPDAKARSLYREKAYGKHPFGRPALGRRKTVEALTPDDCVAFHKRAFVPNNTIVAVVGDFDSKQVIEEIKQLTGAWKNAPVAYPGTPPIPKPASFAEQIVSMPNAAQLHFFMGHIGIARKNPDYFKLLVMDYVLGTGPGFTDRLSARLRDREGLAYTVTANISSSAGEEPGLFTCYIGTQPENFAKVKAEFLEELNRIRDEKPKSEEVEDAKKYLLGSLPFQVSTSKQVGEQLLYVERHGLGFGYLDDYRKAVAAVTPEDVQEVAKKYIDPEHMVLVAAGAIDAKGQPLAKPKPEK